MTKFTGYVGTYTKGDSKGIYSFTLDTENEKISDVKVAAQLENPTYVTVSSNNKYLYSVAKQGDQGGIAAYSINGETGELSEINKQLFPGGSPCYVSVDSSNETAALAYYHQGTVQSFKVNPETGKVNAAVSLIEHKGSGPNKDRQDKSHAHFSGFTPDEKYVVAIDLGTDKIITYEVKDAELTEASTLTVHAGSGPRHIGFHPNGKYAYVMTELSNEVIALVYNSADGSFTEQQYIFAIPGDFKENSQGSAIHISPDGKFVYAGNRGHDSIAVFSIDQDTGLLELVDYTSTEGNWPRDFVLDPSGKYIVASNQETGNLVLYSRNEQTGKLKVLQSDVAVPYPVCVKFLNQ
ncbi:lactonase family protein [Actinomycetes bacterium NPDC127524]